MIVRLDKEQQRNIRRQLLNDVVSIISHEVLRQMQREGYTELSPVEVFLSARNFCKVVVALPDIDEGLDDEMDDIEDETEGKNDFMLIMTLACVQLQAMSKRTVGVNLQKIISRIFERLDGHNLLWPLIVKLAKLAKLATYVLFDRWSFTSHLVVSSVTSLTPLTPSVAITSESRGM